MEKEGFPSDVAISGDFGEGREAWKAAMSMKLIGSGFGTDSGATKTNQRSSDKDLGFLFSVKVQSRRRFLVRRLSLLRWRDRQTEAEKPSELQAARQGSGGVMCGDRAWLQRRCFLW
ncbi:hypothetical protein U1Q18_027563 [Sarracenia purpurea var. burkii]